MLIQCSKNWQNCSGNGPNLDGSLFGIGSKITRKHHLPALSQLFVLVLYSGQTPLQMQDSMHLY